MTDGKVSLKELREYVFVKETYSDSEGKEESRVKLPCGRMLYG
jgi:hypothetical protein